MANLTTITTDDVVAAIELEVRTISIDFGLPPYVFRDGSLASSIRTIGMLREAAADGHATGAPGLDGFSVAVIDHELARLARQAVRMVDEVEAKKEADLHHAMAVLEAARGIPEWGDEQDEIPEHETDE